MKFSLLIFVVLFILIIFHQIAVYTSASIPTPAPQPPVILTFSWLCWLFILTSFYQIAIYISAPHPQVILNFVCLFVCV